MSAPPEPTAPPSSSLRRWVLPVLLALVGIAALVYFLAPYRSAIHTALNRSSIETLVAITALSLVALPLRTEVWRSGLAAADRHPPRSDLHAVNSASLTVGLANHYAAPAVKWWLMRKLEGERAVYLLKLATVDLGTTVIEGFLAGALVVFATFSVSLDWWLPVLVLAGATGLLLLAIIAWRRHPEHPVVQGLGVLMRPRYRWEVLFLVAAVFTAQIVRTWLALRAVGVPIDLGDALLVFVLTGVLGFLPSGVTAAPTAASLIVLGSRGVGKAAASGILVTGSLAVATLLYALLALTIRFVARQRRPGPASSPREAL